MSYTLLHTAALHEASFERLRQKIAPDVEITHQVRTDWLDRAQREIDGGLRSEITKAIDAATGPVLCSCTTLGPVAEAAGAIRIDQPMMQMAARLGRPVMMAYCLRSTETPSLDLLRREMSAAGNTAGIIPLFLGRRWPLFATGQTEAFATTLAEDIAKAVQEHPLAGCVVLAQASMAAVADHLTLSIPVFSSPELAFRTLIAQHK